jgi:pyrroloquinoline quinone (PQQ) biosynthesis protein C
MCDGADIGPQRRRCGPRSRANTLVVQGDAMSTNDKGALDLIRLRSVARRPWWELGTKEAIAEASEASEVLAARAYRGRDLEARRQAETIIYFLNLDSCFAPPLRPAPAVVWTTLMQAKLSQLREEYVADVSGDLGVDEMTERLESAVNQWGAFNHPVLGVLENSGAVEPYRVWAKNWFGSCYGFSQQLASLVQRTTGEVKKTVLENLNDEFDDAVTHDTLRVRFYESLGLGHSPEEAIYDPDWVPGSTELLNLRTGLCNLESPLWALGCFYTVEANWPPECRRHHAMNKARGLDEHTLEYWTTHAFADEHHSEEWLDAVKSLCQTGQERAAVIEGALIQLRLRWRMYDEIQKRVEAAIGE